MKCEGVKPVLYFYVEHLKDFVIIGMSATQNVPYEFKSIMHYDAFAASINDSEPTIIPFPWYNVSLHELGSSTVPTEYDYLHINLLYCEGELFCSSQKFQQIM